MIRKESVILLIILAALVGLSWYFNQPSSPLKETPTSTATTETPQFLFPSDSKTIAGFVLTSQEGTSVSLERGPGGVWIVKRPFEGIADQSKGEEAASQLTALRIMTTLESAPPTSATGLDQPGYILTITTTDGKSISAKIGSSTVTNSGYYIEDATGKVIVVNKYNIDTLLGLLSNPPYAETPTPSPTPSETPTPTPTVESSATSTSVATSKP